MKVKKIKSKKIVRKVVYGVLCCAFGWYLHGRMIPSFGAANWGNETPRVFVKSLLEKDVSPAKKFIAQAEAINSVDIMPQVSGYLEDILFEDGAAVEKGDKIFIIEQRKYKADLKAAQARVFQLKRDFDRMVKLHKTGDIPEKQLDAARSNLEQSEAALDLAKLNLEHSEITAPISGVIGKALVTKGNLVSPNTQKLARLVQVDPIRIAFSVSDKERSSFLKKAVESEDVFIEIALPDGSARRVNADKLFFDNEVNPNTATLPVYVELENKDHQLIPGNYVDLYIRFSENNTSLLVPQIALAADINGTYVMTVNSDNVVLQKYIKTGAVIDDYQVVESGLNPTDKVIVKGLQKVQNGITVIPTDIIE